ncbi:MAG TPA: 2-dehydropantoate 2-reductase N-terminal domain-containing protein [Phototrophicaceae bacterium]|nr:2-dehydropantoate 2-reductase N-terminal domain-containing protein [Phototrophicaceae bacterium]
MKILVLGAGVIGTIYGQLFAEAGHEVVHYVRAGKSAQYEGGIDVHLLDGRHTPEQERRIHYLIRVTEQFAPSDGYDLILVSVRHYQLESVLPILARSAGSTEILFFNGLWTDFSSIDRYLPRQQYLWGYPVAGGALNGCELTGALMNEVRLGETDGAHSERVVRLSKLFESAQLKVDVRADMLHWLWMHFAQEAAVIGVGLKVGDSEHLMTSVGALHEVILCMRETWQICAARGIDLKIYERENAVYYQPAWFAAGLFKLYFRMHPLERRIMSAHTGVEELKRIYDDTLAEGKRLGVETPHFSALKPRVEAYVRSALAGAH